MGSNRGGKWSEVEFLSALLLLRLRLRKFCSILHIFNGRGFLMRIIGELIHKNAQREKYLNDNAILICNLNGNRIIISSFN